MLLAVPTVVVGVVVGYARGGSLGRVGAARLRLAWVLAVAAAAQVALVAAEPLGLSEPARLALLISSLLAVLVFVWANRALPGMRLILMGFALNAAVIIPNGAMPVSPDALAALGGEQAIEEGKHRLLEDGDMLPWLADIIPVPGLRIVVSVGDIVLALGVGALIHRLMLGPEGRHAAPYGSSAAGVVED